MDNHKLYQIEEIKYYIKYLENQSKLVLILEKIFSTKISDKNVFKIKQRW